MEASESPAARAGAPVIPGYRTERLLGFGSTGEVWAAVHELSDERVALKVLRVGAPDQDRLLRELAVLRRIGHPHVVRLREATALPGFGVVLVLDRALGGTLASLVRARGTLDVGEVVTVLTPLASALADLHARGILHGDVAPGNVLFDDRGRPLLADLGLARVVGDAPSAARAGTPGFVDPAVLAGGDPDDRSDVYGLAALGWLALTGQDPPPPRDRPPLVTLAPHVPTALAVLLEDALDADPGRRPTAHALATRCFDSAPAEPVRLVPTDPAAPPAEVVTHRLRAAVRAGAAVQDQHERGRHRRSGPALAGATLPRMAAAVTAAVLAVGAAWLVAPVLVAPQRPAVLAEQPASASARATVAAPEVPAAVEAALHGDSPEAAVPALAWLRARAFATGDATLLERAGTPGGQARAADLRRLRSLRASGVLLRDLGFDVRSTTLVSRDDGSAVVDATVVTSAHRHVDAGGEVVREVPRADERLSRLVLRRGPAGWQVDRLG